MTFVTDGADDERTVLVPTELNEWGEPDEWLAVPVEVADQWDVRRWRRLP